MFDYFYHEILRKTIIGFGTLFNGITVKHKKDSGEVISLIKVPIAYGPTQKFLARVEQQPNLNKPVQITLPRMSFELVGLSYDPGRKVTSTQTFLSPTTSDKTDIRKAYMPVPYNMDFELSIMTKLDDDMLQIVEQILPYFGPSYTISINLLNLIGEKRDVPVTLNSISMSDDYEGDFSTRRALIHTLQFTAKTYLFGPIADSTDGIIRKVQVDYYTDTNRVTAKREVRYTATPTALKDYDNDAGSILTEDVSIGETLISVNDTSTLSVGNRIIIGSEIMKVVSKESNSITVRRAYDGTIQSEHIIGTQLHVLSSADNALIAPGDDFGFSEDISFFQDGGDFSPTRKIDLN